MMEFGVTDLVALLFLDFVVVLGGDHEVGDLSVEPAGEGGGEVVLYLLVHGVHDLGTVLIYQRTVALLSVLHDIGAG